MNLAPRGVPFPQIRGERFEITGIFPRKRAILSSD